MSTMITRIEIRYEEDVVHARQRARLIAELLGFERQDQTRISTAVSEISRNAYQYGGGGEVQFLVKDETAPQILSIQVRDHGPGICDIRDASEGSPVVPTNMGTGIISARRLMDHFRLESSPGKGTTAFLDKILPFSAPRFTSQTLTRINETLIKTRSKSPFEEISQQNRELLYAMDELVYRQKELEALNQELDDTNKGVLALYTELDDKNIQLGRVNLLQSRFLSYVSHEFRTPLYSIMALSRLLLDHVDGNLTEEQEKQIHFIRKSAEDLTELVNDLLDLAKIEAGKIVLRPRTCMVTEILNRLHSMFKPLFTTRKLKLVFEPADKLPPLFTDDGKVAQILHNFLSNALKFTEQGEIRVSTRLSDDEQKVVFAVADTGIGISPEDQERIFDEYTQVITLRHDKFKGSGLGLPISRKLARMLGGQVQVESRPGKGATFSAHIPLKIVLPKDEAGDAETIVAFTPDHTRSPESMALDKGPMFGTEEYCIKPVERKWFLDKLQALGRRTPLEKVLIIDDEEAARYILKAYLAGTCYTVIEAADGEQGLRLAETEQPGVVFLDLMMPGMNGFEVLQRLRANPGTRDIPVIIITSKVLNQTERHALSRDNAIQAGWDVLPKAVEK